MPDEGCIEGRGSTRKRDELKGHESVDSFLLKVKS